MLGLRPPPWLALPPLLAISRCFAGSIAAKPRLEPPLFDVGITLSLIEQRPGNARLWPRFTMLIEVRERLFSRFRSVALGDLLPFRLAHAKQAGAASFAAAAPDAVDASRARRGAAVSENAAQDQREYRPVFLCQLPSEEQSCGNPQRPQCPIRIILA